jgi:hypothetical protein
LKQHANCQGWKSLTTENGLQRPAEKQAKEDGKKTELQLIRKKDWNKDINNKDINSKEPPARTLILAGNRGPSR